MTRKHNPKQKQSKKGSKEKQKKQSRHQFPITPRNQSLLRRWFVLLPFVLSVLSFGFLIYPRLSVSPGISINKSNPFDTPFLLVNNGYLPITNINYNCYIRNVTLLDGSKPIQNISITVANVKIEWLSASKSSTIIFKPTIFSSKRLLSAEIDIVVRYEPFPYVPWKWTYNQGFGTILNYTGELIWTPFSY